MISSLYSKIKFMSLCSISCLGTLCFMSCENDLKDIDRMANIKVEENVNISKDVTVTYSDSAIVKAQLTAAELREYPDSLGIYEFKKGFSGNVIEYVGEFELEVTWFNKVYKFLRKVKSLMRR